MLGRKLTTVQGVTLLRCKGPISAGADLERLRAAAFKRCHDLLLLEISAADTIDAAGLSFLLALHDCAKRRGGTLAILNPSPWAEEILRITQLNSVLQILTMHETGVGCARTRYPEVAGDDRYRALPS
jgi:anti-anti-sigma factor